MTPENRILIAAACALLLAAASLCAGCSSSPGTTSTPATQATPVATSMIAIKNMAFVPASVIVPAGTTVTWMNEDSVAHTVVADDGAPEPFSSPSTGIGGLYSYTFNVPGTYHYHCSIHPAMTGTIVVKG